MPGDRMNRTAGGSVAGHAALDPEMTEEHRAGAMVSGSGAFTSDTLEKPSWAEHFLEPASDPRASPAGPVYGASWDASVNGADTKSHIGYTFVNPDGQVYSGIASGYGDAEDILKKRWNSHHQDELGKLWEEGRYAYGLRVEVISTNRDAIEGWEARSIERHGGPLQYGGTSANWANPVGDRRYQRLDDAQHREFPGLFPTKVR
jgi:hypothetical protein